MSKAKALASALQSYEGPEKQEPSVLARMLMAQATDAPQELPLIDVGVERHLGDEAHEFVLQQLHSGEPQVPQHDVQAELDAYRNVTHHMPGAATVKAFGALPDFKGGAEPGVAQELYNGDYKNALSDLFGVALGYGLGRVIKPVIWPKGGKNPPHKQKK